MRRTLAERLSSLDAIPKDLKAAEKWASELCEILHESYKTQGTFIGRLSLLLKVLDVINQYPIAFAKWSAALTVIKARLKTFRSRKKNGLVKEVNRPPYSISELRQMLEHQESFDGVLLALVYLQYGFRAKEAERLLPEHGVSGRLELAKVITKTTTDKKPPLFLLSKAVLRSVELKKGTLSSSMEGIDRKRLRPTSVVMLTLSGQDVLTIIQRTGHKDVRMLVSQYAKFMPNDFRIGQSSQEYLDLDRVELGGKLVAESIWDQWLLMQALQASRKFGANWFIDLVKALHAGHELEGVKKVVSF